MGAMRMTQRVPLKLFVKSVLSSPRKSPIFILGNQKSGTTAIAQLLSMATGLSYSHDMFFRWNWNCISQLHSGHLPVAKFIRLAAHEFERHLIKDPDLTFLYNGLRKHFPLAQFVFVLRNPATNIRSILNRHNIPGRGVDCQSFEVMARGLSPLWKTVFQPDALGLPGGSHLDVLAQRWDRCAQIYLSNQSDLIGLRYEVFLQNKRGSIEELANRLRTPVINDISNRIDVQFQPKGDHSQTLEDFFGQEGLGKIRTWCAGSAYKLNYDI
jgi:hypothetical protein